MVEVNKDVVKETLQWLELLLDEGTTLSQEEKGKLSTLINFWRLYDSFMSKTTV